MKRFLLCLIFVVWGITLPVTSSAKIKVLTTFSVLEDFATQIGKDRIEVSSIVPPDADPHVYEPTPSDVKRITEADLILMNGLGFESWFERLLKAAPPKGKVIICTDHVHPRLVFEGTIIKDPHAWHSIPNAKIYIRNITDAFKSVDSKNADYYEKNAQDYLDQLTQLDEKIRRDLDKIPPQKRKIITAHDAFGYLGHSYGIQFLSPQGISTESEAKIQNVIGLIKQIREQNIKTVFIENISDSKVIRQISQETGATIGGSLYSDALSDTKGKAPTYVAMITYNMELLLNAMRE